ncbi:mediator of RNA polymerase II transcription subunit 15-like isoform X3 [Biomphalaria glabrata]|uniref:Mediator of RNA polymerase II transcription subunit 15 n=1 Tax=Biomphalaria glabrata TaxID=6526 RepID=A0A9W2YK34_BIOGL|nr:mediator of RNA polymerase II transcription subunit 15-like isoform X3 [Biomphalaria glabrata]
MSDPNRMQEDYPAASFRMKIVNRLEEVMRNSQTQMPKTSSEMEDYVFNKARTREEYLDLVARLLLTVSDQNKDKKMNLNMGPNMGQPGGPMRPQVSVSGQDQDPMNALQSLAGPSMGRQQHGEMFGGSYEQTGDQFVNQFDSLGGMMQGMGGPMVNQQQMANQQSQQQRMMDMRQQQQQQMQQQQQRMMMNRMPQLQRQDAFLVTSPQGMAGVQGQPIPSSTGISYQGPGGPIRNMGPIGLSGHYMQGRDMGLQGMPVQSPAQNSPLTMLPSPHGMMPSPGMRPQMGVASPSTVLHTPGTAVSDPSPGPPSTSLEEQEYIRKLEKLSCYIEPLRKFVLESEKKTDEDSKKNHKKMKSLLDILSNPKKRVPINVLEKCQQVLEKLTTSFNVPITQGHMCQPLLDAVAHFSTATMLNHSLHRTFGPALEAYKGASLIKAPSPPVSRKRKLEKEKTEELPDILQGEIARLGRRFIVSVDPRHHPGSESHHLVCKLEDINLPSVPPLMVTIPKTYPKSSPRCDPTGCPGYDATEFLQNVQQNLSVHLSNMPNRFCLTQLLSSWELSVRKACDPVNPLIAQPSSAFV